MFSRFLIHPLIVFAVLLIVPGCIEEKEEIVIVTKRLKKQKETSTAVPDEFSSFAPAVSGTNYWVEGKVRNDGAEDAKNVDIVFHCTEGVNERVMTATVKLIPAGKTVAYKTKGFLSKYDVKLNDEEPEEIVVGE